MFFAEIKDKKDEIFVKRKDNKDFASQIYWFFSLFTEISGLIFRSNFLNWTEAVRARLGAKPPATKKSKQPAAGENFWN